jgi:uncharacterized membrane protein YhaH (DUF805 family)
MSNPESKGMNGDIANSSLTEKEKIAWQTRRWKNRRRMAWLAMLNLTAIVLLYFFAPIPDARLTIIAEPLAMITFGFVGIVGAYMGFTTFEKYKMGK